MAVSTAPAPVPMKRTVSYPCKLFDLCFTSVCMHFNRGMKVDCISMVIANKMLVIVINVNK